MCYDIKTSLETQLKRARRFGDSAAVEALKTELKPHTDLPLYHASGYAHPRLLIYTNASPEVPLVARWGLVPFWVKDEQQFKKIWNNTLNARGESIFEKPAFRDGARYRRCLIYVDGFYEHHHFRGQTYPFFIRRSDAQPMALGGLWSEWIHLETGEIIHTFTIVTTRANAMLEKIHNNPKASGPRMPVVLEEHDEDEWLNATNKAELEPLIKPYSEHPLHAHPVGKLRGKQYMGNTPTISEEVHYPELELADLNWN